MFEWEALESWEGIGPIVHLQSSACFTKQNDLKKGKTFDGKVPEVSSD